MTSSARILQVGYYPMTNPISGGQRRVANIMMVLRGLGANVRYCAVSPRRPDVAADDLAMSVELDNWVFRVPYDFERRLGDVLCTTGWLRSALLTKAREHEPDVVWLEHPFL